MKFCVIIGGKLSLILKIHCSRNGSPTRQNARSHQRPSYLHVTPLGRSRAPGLAASILSRGHPSPVEVTRTLYFDYLGSIECRGSTVAYRGGEKVSVLFPHRHRHHQRCCDGDVLCYNFTSTGRIPVFLGALQSRDPCRSNAPKKT